MDHLDSTENRVLGGLGVGVCGSGPSPGRFWSRGQWSLFKPHWNVAPCPWIWAMIMESSLSIGLSGDVIYVILLILMTALWSVDS